MQSFDNSSTVYLEKDIWVLKCYHYLMVSLGWDILRVNNNLYPFLLDQKVLEGELIKSTKQSVNNFKTCMINELINQFGQLQQLKQLIILLRVSGTIKNRILFKLVNLNNQHFSYFFFSGPCHMNATFFEVLDAYMVSGVLNSDLPEDGGLACYLEIPLQYHTAFVIALSLILLVFFFKWKNHLYYTVKEQNPTNSQKRMAIFALLSWILTAYFKLKTGKGIFMFNPCHIILLAQVYLLCSKNTKKNTAIHTAWSGWLFGPYLALLIPHVNGIGQFELFLYYFEHLVIVPFGYLVLSRRYGFVKPTIKNQMAAFATIGFWQFLVLVPLSRNTMVNLNYALCHSPADPSFQVIGYYYFLAATVVLNILSYLTRWVCYIQIKILSMLLSLIGIKNLQVTINSSQSIETPGQIKP